MSIQEMEEAKTLVSRRSFKLIENFNILPNPPSDHHYLKKTHSRFSASKTINNEWKMLRQGLPDSIFVQLYESRMDLMRAAIVGVTGTPYADGLFFFDISFPDNYPLRPPSVYFHSHGLHLNPNLYRNGLICLSLLNTWSGKKEEKWIPNKSTVLQLLVSIQGLVLNKCPYYNEPGERFNPKAALEYNVSCFRQTCRLMICILKTPPENFEEMVKRFFQEKGSSILENCRAKMGASRLLRPLFYELARLLEEKTSVTFTKLVDEVREEELMEHKSMGFLTKVRNNVVDYFEYKGRLGSWSFLVCFCLLTLGFIFTSGLRMHLWAPLFFLVLPGLLVCFVKVAW